MEEKKQESVQPEGEQAHNLVSKPMQLSQLLANMALSSLPLSYKSE